MKSRLIPFHVEHLDRYENPVLMAGMAGVSIMTCGGKILASGGTIDCEWGKELWILVADDLEESERACVARVARQYVHSLFTQHGELWTSSFEGQEKWLRWLGFDLAEVLPVKKTIVKRWRILKGAPKWESKQPSS